jgi:hypothetical protein
LVFRVPQDAFERGESAASVACPRCSRRARIERGSGGRVRIVHRGHILVCPAPLSSNPLAVVFAYVGALAAVALAFAAVARLVPGALCPVVLFATLVAVGLIGATQLAMQGRLDRTYVELMAIFYKGLPYLLLRRAPDGKVVPEAATSGG